MKKVYVGLFLDLTKAFDMVNQDFCYKNWMHMLLEEWLISGFCFLSTKQKTAGKSNKNGQKKK